MSNFYRNFNREIFTRRPEFCLLYEKLQRTCQSWKREALTEKYPDLCSTIREVNESVNICPNIRNSSLLNPILFRLNGTILKLRDELFVYARDNLAVVNIYIKDATVTKIRRDQKVKLINSNRTFYWTLNQYVIQCLKITQNVAFCLSGNTVCQQTSGFGIFNDLLSPRN